MHNRRGFNKQWRVFINEMKIKISLTKQQVMDASIVLPNVTILFPFQKHEFWYKHSDADQPHPCRPLNIPMIIIRSVTLQIHDEIYILNSLHCRKQLAGCRSSTFLLRYQNLHPNIRIHTPTNKVSSRTEKCLWFLKQPNNTRHSLLE